METGYFIIEGIKIIKEALDYDYELKNIIFSHQLRGTAEGQEFFREIENFKNLICLPDKIFNEISDTENPQGIMGLAKINYKDIGQIENKGSSFFIYLDQVQDPGNIGTIIRTGDGFNIDGIIITEGTVDPYNPKVVRATMGSIFRIPIYYSDGGLKDLNILKEKGFKLLSTSLYNSQSLFDAQLKESLVITIGNESKGVSQEILQASDGLISIPMPGGAESLNAGVAASIIMYEAMRQKT